MSYVPNNTSVYLRAFAGFMAGITAAAKTDTNAADFTFYAQMADAYSQQLDTQWGETAPTSFELYCIAQSSEAVWENSSVLPASVAVLPGAYTQVAASVVARVQQGNAQIVSEGISPSDPGAGGAQALLSTQENTLDTPIALSSSTAPIIAALDIQSVASGYFVFGATVTYSGSGSDVHTWEVTHSDGITAGYTGGSTAFTLNPISGKTRYHSGGVIAGGTGGTGPAVVGETAVAVGAGVQVAPAVSGIFKVAPGTRVGLVLTAVATSGSNMIAGLVNFWAYELPLGAVAQ